MQPEKRDLPPLLSKAEKTQSWTAPVQHAQRSVKTEGVHHGLGEQLSGSLKKQVQSKQAELVKKLDEAPKSAVRTCVLSTRSLSQSKKVAPAPEKRLFSSSVNSVHDQQNQSGNKVLPEDALSNVFQRISSPIDDKPKPKTVTRKGIFGRLGRP